jgi:hypothetical protein
MTGSHVWLPREHGAYGQIVFPLAAAFIVAGVSTAGSLLALAVVAGFLAHEPAAILLGQRGPRARRELGAAAARSLAAFAAIAAVASVTAVIAIEPSVRWSLFVPAAPAVVLAVAMIRGCEKSWYGETAAALAFSTVPVPVTMAAGVATNVAWAVAIPFAVLFITTTLAVRVVILRVRSGGNPRATAATQRATLTICAASAAIIVALVLTGWIPWWVVLATAPGPLAATAVVIQPPAPARLRSLGWMLVGVSTLTAVIVAAAA